MRETQATLQRRLIHRSLLLNTLPLTFMGVVLSLNTFSDSVRAAFVPLFGACLLGLALAVLWIELAVSRVPILGDKSEYRFRRLLEESYLIAPHETIE